MNFSDSKNRKGVISMWRIMIWLPTIMLVVKVARAIAEGDGGY
jgi:hypothetical protein